MHEVQKLPIRPSAYLAPASLEAALSALAKPGSRTRVIAGGTDLMVELDHRVGGEFDLLVDISRIAGMDTITVDSGRVHLGPLVTHNQCATSQLVRRHGLALAQASLEVGSPALRNRATVAGNVVTASPANDTISALAALDAELELTSLNGSRKVSLADFHTGVRATVLTKGELVTSISFPTQTAATSVFVKAGLRRAQAISLVHVAVACELDPHTGRCSGVRIALGSVAPTIVSATAAEQLLDGAQLSPDNIAQAALLARQSVSPIDDARSTADYRADLVEIMVKRALSAIADGTEGAALALNPQTLGGPNVTADETAVQLRPGDQISCTLNGRPTAAPWSPTSLLEWLRESAGLTGTKEGCAEGECGACTVHVDGVATLSCLIPAGRAQGARIGTIEGLSHPQQLHPLQQAFVDCAAVQCGYCIPGFLMAGAALQTDTPAPTPAELELGLSGNLCRCTGYYSIKSAFAPAHGAEQ